MCNFHSFVSHLGLCLCKQAQQWAHFPLVEETCNSFVGSPQVQRASSPGYDGLNMHDREQTISVGGVYRDLHRNTQETAGIHLVNVIIFP